MTSPNFYANELMQVRFRIVPASRGSSQLKVLVMLHHQSCFAHEILRGSPAEISAFFDDLSKHVRDIKTY